MEKSQYPTVINDLEQFKNLFIEYFGIQETIRKGEIPEGEKEEAVHKLYHLREEINKKTPIIKYYFYEASVSYNYPLAGRLISLLEDVLNPLVYSVLESCGGFFLTIDAINKCIGFYEYLVKSKKTIVDLKITPIIDIINLIKKNLRKSFKKEPIEESAVQEHIQTILDIANVSYSKEKESFEYSSKFYKPDFVIKDLETVIEAKLCNSKSDESKIIGEINDDIVAYKTKYKILIFIVYDVGIIRDEDKFKENLTDISGVYIEVIKH